MNALPRLMKIAAIAVTVLMILLIACLTGISLLVGTNAGSSWLLEKLLAQAQSESRTLTVERTLGTLLSGLDVENLHYRDESIDLRIGSVRARWNPMNFLSGEIRVDQALFSEMNVQWLGAQTDPEEVSSDPFSDYLPLPWPIAIDRIAVDGAQIAWPEGNYSVDALTLAARLQGTELQLEALRYTAPPLAIQGEGQIHLQTGMALSGHWDWQYTGPLAAGLEDATGSLDLSGDLNTLHLAHQLTQPVQISSEGDIELQLFNPSYAVAPGFRLRHELPAQIVQAADLVEDRQLRLDSASLNTTGDFSTLNLGGEARLTVEQSNGTAIAPALNLNWQARLEGSSLSIETVGLETASGRADASGLLQWDDGMLLQLHLNASEQDGSQYQPLLPEGLLIGALQGEADVSWQRSDSGDQFQARILSLRGMLNEYPLSADGSLSYGEGVLRVEDLRASSGSTRLAVNGQWDEQVDLRWQLEADDLGTLSPLFGGSIEATGRIQGTPEAPQISLSAAGSDIDLAGLRVNSLSATGDYLNNSNRLQLTLEGLEPGTATGERIDSLTLTATGLPADHELRARVTSPRGEMELSLTGEWRFGDTVPWLGNLRSGRITSDLGDWQLAAPASLQAGAESAVLARQCWQEGPSTLCLEGHWEKDAALSASASLEDYPLEQFNAPAPGTILSPTAALLPRLPVGTRAAGTLSANARVEGNPTDVDALSLAFDVNAGEGQFEVDPPPSANESEGEAEPQILYWRTATLEGRHNNGEWNLASRLDFYQPDLEGSGITVQGNADAELSILADGQLDGQVNLAFQDLSWVAAFVPILENPRGQLRGLSLISGTLDAPRVGGNINVSDAAVDIPALGISLQDITTSLTSDNDQTLVIQGRASSGEGTLRFVSEVTTPLSPDRRIDMSVNGQDFMLVNNEQLVLTLSPDLQIRGDANALDFSGSLTLPVVDVQINTLPESAIDVSPDTVLVNNAPEPEQVRNAAQADRGVLDAVALTAEVRIALGDQARFRGFGLDARLSGALDITQRSTGAPLTYGELTVLEGNYQTYGRTLNIEHGKLLFFGAMDNPALDIRAVRQAEDVKVGVQMNGTLRNIRSQLFSTPTLPDGDIIAVMLTGRPLAEVGTQDSNALIGAITSLGINQGQGITNQIRNQLGLDTLAITSTGDTSNSSLTLGKYLTPKLFIRYGVGLFETESTLAVDYSVTDRIKLEAKSGSTQSVDIKYTVER